MIISMEAILNGSQQGWDGSKGTRLPPMCFAFEPRSRSLICGLCLLFVPSCVHSLLCSRYSSFRNQHFQIPIPSRKCLQLVGDNQRAIGLSVIGNVSSHPLLITLVWFGLVWFGLGPKLRHVQEFLQVSCPEGVSLTRVQYLKRVSRNLRVAEMLITFYTSFYIYNKWIDGWHDAPQ